MEVVKLWRDAAPSLEEMRSAPAGDPVIMQRILDANFMGAGLAVLVGGTVSYVTKSWVPVLLSLAVVAFMSYWYRQVLAADHTIMEG
jgi:hypothetical protein